MTETATLTHRADNDSTAVDLAPSGHRLPAATSLGRVRLQIADLERSLDWYQNVLGLRTVERSEDRAVLSAHGDEAPLVELVERPGATPVPRRGRLGLYHFALLLPDRRSLGAFLQHLANLGERAGASDHLVSEALYLQDPDGLGIEVYADRPRDQWTVVNRQISMDTIPLNANDLLAHSAGHPWSGVPTGTQMGHVHLHVGAIEEADAFYHQGLGFDRVVWSYPGALFLSAGGYHHHLGLNTWAAASPGATDSDARLLDWEIRLPSADDVEAARASLNEHGYEVRTTEDGLYATDPWGTAVRLVTQR
ncbi:MAG: VOC family protein [Trueperaceae bacterium]